MTPTHVLHEHIVNVYNYSYLQGTGGLYVSIPRLCYVSTSWISAVVVV